MSDDERGSFLVHAVTLSTKNVALERIRDRGADVVMAVYRLVKTAFVHALENQAVAAAVTSLGTTVRDFAASTGGAAVVTFVGDTVFVSGQLLRASRGSYEAAIELSTILLRAGVSEVGFDASVPDDAIAQFCSALTTSVRDPSRHDALLGATFAGMHVRRVDPDLESSGGNEASVPDRIVRAYATALVVMRRFFDDVAAGTPVFPHRVKRLAQRLVSLFELRSPSLLAVTALASRHRDDAGRAVQSALLAIACAWNVTQERLVLSRLAMAALLADVGRVRLAGEARRDRLVALGDAVEAVVPAETAQISIAMAGVNFPNALRTVTMHEATWLERSKLLGPVYTGGLAPLVEARILEVVRALVIHLAPRDASRSLSLMEALAVVGSAKGVDPIAFRLLMRAIGLLPVGTVVELNTGEWAVVDGTEAGYSSYPPKVRVVTDGGGRALASPFLVDLAHPAAPRIARIVEPERSRFNVVRPLLS